MSLNHVCFVWLKTSSFNAFGELWITKSPMKHKVMKLEIVNQKITLQVQSSNTILQWYPKLVWDLWITHHCPCQKTNKKRGSKVACNLSSNLEKLCNNLSMQAK
jgi:hypothetical protein